MKLLFLVIIGLEITWVYSEIWEEFKTHDNFMNAMANTTMELFFADPPGPLGYNGLTSWAKGMTVCFA